MTFRETVSYLQGCGIDSPYFESQVIFESLFGISSAEIPLIFDKDFDNSLLMPILSKRSANYPLQYILGKWDFYGLTFEVNENCLCPRPDTEILVEKAIEILPENAKILELCTGSGCIPISICKTRTDVSARSTDLFPKTLELAKTNAEKHGVCDRLKFILADVFDHDKFLCDEGRGFLFSGEKLDAIISNPPYIKTSEIQTLSKEVKYEPHAALDGGEDGLIFYNEIVENYGKYLKDSGIFIFEIGYDQGKSISLIAEKNKYKCKLFNDYSGNNRVAVIHT